VPAAIPNPFPLFGGIRRGALANAGSSGLRSAGSGRTSKKIDLFAAKDPIRMIQVKMML